MRVSTSARNSTDPAATAGPTASHTGDGLWSRLLRLPLYYKLIIANTAVALAAVFLCATLVAAAVRRNPDADTSLLIIGIVLIAAALGAVVNAVVVRLALSPLQRLTETAARVSSGDMDARAEPSAVADAATQRLIDTFNEMLDALAAYRQRLRTTAIRAIDAGEAERKRLSRELHDGLAQSLAAVQLQLRAAVRSDDTTNARRGELSHQISDLIDDVRSMALSLRPPALDMLGLSAAVMAYARSVAEATGMHVDVSVEGVDGVLPRESELALYRIVQDALQNAVRHADSDAARVDLHRSNGSVEAVISDTGSGFDLERARAEGSPGLFGMVERAGYVGGRVDIRTSPGTGTEVQVRIPIRESE